MKARGTLQAKRRAGVFERGEGLPKALMCHVGVVSRARPQNVAEVESIIGPATWYVGEGDGPAYLDAGAFRVIESGGLCPSRNMVLDHAFGEGKTCIQVSDDLRKIEALRVFTGKHMAQPYTFRQAVTDMVKGIGAGAMLAGVAPTSNPFYGRKEPNRKAFIVADLIAVSPCKLRFDERFRFKEDYDYTLQHLEAFGEVYRCDHILASFLHKTNAGGGVDFRTLEKEREAIALLHVKWGSRIRLNPRREGEVLLKWR